MDQIKSVVSQSLKVWKNLTESINKMQVSLGQPSLGKIIDDELPIAKKLRAHIKSD